MSATSAEQRGGGARGRQAYLPIAEHGIVGDMHTAALVGTDGRIDWWCCPRFDSPSVFGSILDHRRGGHWTMSPHDDSWTSKQLYLPSTNILITRFFTDGGVVEISDFMPIGATDDPRTLMRRVSCVRGAVVVDVEISPQFNYGRTAPHARRRDNGITFTDDHRTLYVSSTIGLRVDDGAARGSVTLDEGHHAWMRAEYHDGAAPDDPGAIDPDAAQQEHDQTSRYWRTWLAQSTYRGRWRETVERAALTLKLLTYAPTGAIIAAPTTSLPERIGGVRNWDYRFSWVRDAAFTVYALLRLGFRDEAGSFMSWLSNKVIGTVGTDELTGTASQSPLSVVYVIDGESDREERELDWLEGYEGSRPVRVGNAAARQLQLDIYGELIDSVYLYNKLAQPIDHATWMAVIKIVTWLCDHWDQPDAGIWETRGPGRNYTSSRVMCWVAIERAIRIARQRGLPADLSRWAEERDRIYQQVHQRAWRRQLHAFGQHFGDSDEHDDHDTGSQRDGDGSDPDALDASLLLMPLVKFIAPCDPQWLSTLEAIKRTLVSDSLVKRYDPDRSSDGVDGGEGTFSLCTFWYVEALTDAGRLDEARLVFEKMLTYANHLGLYAEEIATNGAQLGNFPQALTHLALISAAFNLDRRLDHRTDPIA